MTKPHTDVEKCVQKPAEEWVVSRSGDDWWASRKLHAEGFNCGQDKTMARCICRELNLLHSTIQQQAGEIERLKGECCTDECILDRNMKEYQPPQPSRSITLRGVLQRDDSDVEDSPHA